jgi:exosortase A-associated hydrolase 1
MYVQIARELCERGVAVLRFDCRGTGDSDGRFTTFEAIDEDIRSAVDFVVDETSSTQVVLFGLCDGASAAAMFAHGDSRIVGLVLLNPWVRAEATEAQVQLRSYYAKRILQLTFWTDLLSGRLQITKSIRSLFSVVRRIRTASRTGTVSYIDKMRVGIAEFRRPILIVLCEDDYVAQEFQLLSRSSRSWSRAVSAAHVETYHLSDADHTLSGSGEISELICQMERWFSRNLPHTSDFPQYGRA